jgi:hypothetical protein
MEAHQTTFRQKVFRYGLAGIWFLFGYRLVMETTFPELVRDVPGHLLNDGLFETWDWLGRSVCVYVDGEWYKCPSEGDSFLAHLLSGAYFLSLFLWLLTREMHPIAALKTGWRVLKKKLAF